MKYKSAVELDAYESENSGIQSTLAVKMYTEEIETHTVCVGIQWKRKLRENAMEKEKIGKCKPRKLRC